MALYWKGIFNDAVVKVGGTLKVQVFFIISFSPFFFFLSLSSTRGFKNLFNFVYLFLLLAPDGLSCLFLSSFIILRVTLNTNVNIRCKIYRVVIFPSPSPRKIWSKNIGRETSSGY